MDCPFGNTCDGADIVSCVAGQIISDDKKSCIMCSVSDTNMVCDGKIRRTCAEMNAVVCTFAAIFKCKDNFMFNI